MFGKVVVALDGSRASEAGLLWGILVASAAEAPLELVHVYVPWMAEGGFDESVETGSEPGLGGPDRAESQAWIERLRREAREQSGVAVTAEVLEGPVVATLRHHVGERPDRLLVMTTRGQGAGGPTWLGSVADAFARSASVPLLLVPAVEPDSDDDVEAVCSRVLVPLDGTAGSAEVLPTAVRFAALFDAAVQLVQVVSSPDDAAGAEAGLRDRADRTGARDVEIGVVVSARPATAILEEAHESAADIIALASHGESGISRMLLGGAAEEPLHGRSVPMLLVRARLNEPG